MRRTELKTQLNTTYDTYETHINTTPQETRNTNKHDTPKNTTNQETRNTKKHGTHRNATHTAINTKHKEAQHTNNTRHQKTRNANNHETTRNALRPNLFKGNPSPSLGFQGSPKDPKFAAAGGGRALPMSLRAEVSTCAHRTIAGTSIETRSGP